MVNQTQVRNHARVSAFLRCLFCLCSSQFNTKHFCLCGLLVTWAASLLPYGRCQLLIKHEITSFIPRYLTCYFRFLHPNVTLGAFSSLCLGNTIWCFWIFVCPFRSLRTRSCHQLESICTHVLSLIKSGSLLDFSSTLSRPLARIVVYSCPNPCQLEAPVCFETDFTWNLEAVILLWIDMKCTRMHTHPQT